MLNPKYKEKVRYELDKILAARIIVPVEESEWISQMVVQDKKIGGIWICLNLSSLNDAYIHDPFATPFTDEILENVGGREVYSFTDRFLVYHQVKIIEEDKQKMTFAIELGSFAYMVMHFR